MRARRSAPPLWFLVGVAVVVGLVCRALVTPAPAPWDGGGHPVEVRYASWAFIVLIGELIWKGVEVAGKITLEILHFLYLQLSLIVTKLGNGLKVVGSALLAGLKRSWQFLGDTYDKVLKPAWEKFWRWFGRLRQWLDDTFGPLLQHLRDLRDALLKFWSTYVRPWLDLIDVTRRVLRVLNSLGLHWAAALDAKLGALEDAIERPFRLLLAKVNEVINLVNRVVTLDGLLQRVALIRSLARDYKYAWQAMANPYWKPISAAERDRARTAEAPRPAAMIERDCLAFVADRGGDARDLYADAADARRAHLAAR